jgi:hypothetical protein
VIITHDGIVIATDSKQVNDSTGKEGTAEKSVVINDHIVVMLSGLAGFHASWGTYDALAILNKVKSASPGNADVAIVQRLIVKETKPTMDMLARDLAVREARHSKENPFGEKGVGFNYYIVAYEKRIPTVVIIHYQFDWNSHRVIGPEVNIVHPTPNKKVDSDVLFYGWSHDIDLAALPSSDAHKASVARYPGVIKAMTMFRDQTTPRISEAIDMAADMVRLEIEFSPKTVGFPIHITVLSIAKSPVIKTLSKCERYVKPILFKAVPCVNVEA